MTSPPGKAPHHDDTTEVGATDKEEGTDMDLHMPPTLVGDTSFKSLNFHTGIMLLEKQILKVSLPRRTCVECNIPSQSANKRRAKRRAGPKDSAKDRQQDAWMQLARLYKALGEHCTIAYWIVLIPKIQEKKTSCSDYTTSTSAGKTTPKWPSLGN